MNSKEIPVLLLTGYLGSGKTTLVNHILNNKQGIKFAVIVNDIGEVNIDADLIQRGGVVNQKNDSLVSLQNGCICCTLQQDLVDQVFNLLKAQRFDYIVIEASGICDPSPIAQTIRQIPNLGAQYNKYGRCRMDCVATVVDALRMRDEFDSAKDLTAKSHDEDDIENLLIQQIEFCNVILLNKVSEVTAEELNNIKQIIRALQPRAEIIECDYADVDLNKLLDTKSFDFTRVASSAGWVQEIGKHIDEAEAEEHHHHHHEHEHEHEHHHDHDHEEGHEHCDHEHGVCHCHHHHHHNENGEVEEYGISSFVYYRRRPLSLNKFDYFVMSRWPKSVIRCKGVCYFKEEMDMSYLFEQAGMQKSVAKAGRWFAACTESQQAELFKQEPGLLDIWHEKYGDRMQKIVFIGQHMDKEQIIKDLDFCLED